MNPRKIGKVLLLTAAALAISIGALLLAMKLALDRAPRYQAQIKDWVHRQTGYHIAFAGVSPRFRWYGPELYLSRPELRSHDDLRVLARAAGGRVGLDLWQLIRNGKLFALRVELDSPDIVVDRLGPSKFALASEIVLGGDRSPAGELTLNDLPAGRLAMRNGSVSLRHWNAELPRLDLRGVDFDLSRLHDSVAARVSARLPAALGGQLSFTGRAQGSGRMDALEWSTSMTADGVSFPGWRRLLPEYLERLDAGTGSFRTAARGRGRALDRMELEFGAQGVVTRLSDGVNTRIDEVSADLSLTHSGDRWTLEGRRVRAQRGGRRDPNADFDVSWRENESGMLQLQAEANYLRAEALLPLVGLMPQKVVRDRLRELAPTGEWMDMRLDLQRRDAADPWRFDARAKFREVGFAPVDRAPGLRGLSGELAGNELAGHVVLDTQTGVFNWPSQLPQSVPLPVLKTSLYWKRNAAELLVATSDLELRTRDATLRGKMAWHQPSDGGSPVLTMADTIDDGNVADAHLYFLREQLPAEALQWLNRAFVAGHLSHGDIIFDGPLRRFPFRDGGGLFLVRFRADHGVLDYQPGWPRIENLAAQVEFRNQGLDMKVSSAELGTLKVESAQARFADLGSGELEVHAIARGDASAALRYLVATPLDDLADHAFSAVEAKGPMKSAVDLFFPFRQFDQRRILVHLDLDGVSVNRAGSTMAATELTGSADVDGAQVVRAEVHGRALGGAIQMSARAPRNAQSMRTQLDFRGTATGDALRSLLSLPARVDIGGQTDYHAVLRLAPEPSRERTLNISTSLVGLDMKLPAPLTKAAGAAMPTTVAIQWPAAGGAEVRLNLGSVLRGDLVLDSDSSGIGRAAVTFGGGDPAFSNAQTVNVGGSIGELDLAGWIDLLGDAEGGTGGTKPSKGMASFFRAATFQASRIDYLGLSFSDVSIAISEANGGWRIVAGGPNVAGSIQLPGAQDPSAPWDLQFERLKFTETPERSSGGAESDTADQSTAGAPAPAAAKQIDPRSIPAIEFHAAQVVWDDRQFGDVRATLQKLDDGIALKQLTATGETWSANAGGAWRGKDGGTSHISGTITSTDVGNTLKEMGFAAVLQAKTGHVEFDLTWPGAPSGDALASATGRLQVALEKGQIVGLKPGAGRVLGLASLAELRRRLALDFSDLTDKGFAFDSAHGTFELSDGSAHTEDVLVKGPAAEIGLIGRIGLKNHDYDQTAVVTGNVSSTLPLAAFVAGPVVGGAVLLFTQVFKQPLKGLARGYYRITGSWDNPTVERIKGAEAPAAAAEAPQGAAKAAASDVSQATPPGTAKENE